MQVITTGHKYELASFEGGPAQTLQFIEKVPTAEGSKELRTVNDGTTNEEVLKVLIDRLQYLSGGLVRRVVAAACRNSAGRIVVSARHYNPIMRAQIAAAEGPQRWRGCEQGFIDQRGNFLTRQEAHAIASANGQIIRRCGGDTETLYSENLY